MKTHCKDSNDIHSNQKVFVLKIVGRSSYTLRCPSPGNNGISTKIDR